MSTSAKQNSRTLVTLLVTASMALLIWGAVLDGRDEHARLEPEYEAAAQGPQTIRAVDAA